MVSGFDFLKQQSCTKASALAMATMTIMMAFGILAGASNAKTTAPSSLVKNTNSSSSQSIYQKAVIETETTTPSVSLKKEAAQTAKITTAALNEAPAGILKLKDSFESKKLRTWNWLAGFHLQRFGAEGTFTNPVGNNGDLGQAGKVMMPVFDLGLSTQPMSHEFFYQGLLRFGFARQALNLQTAYGSNEATLSSVLLGTQAQIGYQIRSSSLSALAEAGRISYSQSSLQSGASVKTNLNRSLDYLGYGFSFQQKIYEGLGGQFRGQLSWIQRQNLGDSETRIQSSNFEAGATYLW